MTSDVFFRRFLINERDQDILKSQYVLVSTRIRTSGNMKNVISGSGSLFPNSTALMYNIESDDFLEEYYNQLNENIILLATIVQGAIKENFNVIFICSKKEGKLKFLDILSDFIYRKFKYPMYDYEIYADGKYELLKYDREKVLSKCKKYLSKAKRNNIEKTIKNDDIDEKDLKKNPKILKKILKAHGYYWKGMSKDDMFEMLELIE